jgi:hypothetical protein
MWKKLVFSLFTVVPSLALLACGLVLLYASSLPFVPKWLGFLAGCDRMTTQVVGVVTILLGGAATIASGVVFVDGLYSWAFAKEKS